MEGKFVTDNTILRRLHDNKQIALQYVKGEMSNYLNLPANPNGSIVDIAGITDETGRVLGLMPHPERGMFFVQTPNWQLKKEELTRQGKKLPIKAAGLQIFKNAVEYFK